MSLLLTALKNKKGLRRYIGPKRAVILLVLVGSILWVWEHYKIGMLSPEIIMHYLDDYPLEAVFLFIGLYIISVIAALPSLPLNLAAGFFWGGFLGGIYSTLGMALGGWVSFLTARFLIGTPLADRLDNKWAQIVQSEFELRGWKFVAFARINPVVPTGPLNYLLGLTSLSNRTFILTTFIFLLPPAILVSYIGDVLQTFTLEQADVKIIINRILLISAALTVIVVMKYLSNLYKKDQIHHENNSLSDDTE